MFRYTASFLLLSLLLLPAMLFAQYSAKTHFGPGNGYPGDYSFRMFQDKLGYVWIGSENGLARFNGYEFKVFTTKDGLPDNEILYLFEDKTGRLLFAPFSNTIGYIKDGQIHNNINDSVLKRLRLESKAEGILDDKKGNILIAGKKKITCISPEQHITVFDFNDNPAVVQTFAMFKTAGGEVFIVDHHGMLQSFDGRKWVKIRQLPPEIYMFYSGYIIELMGLKAGPALLAQIAERRIPIFLDQSEKFKFNSMCYAGQGMLGVAHTDGFLLFDPATGAIVDTLLPGVPVSFGMLASDSSLWLATHGAGLYRFVRTPIKTLELSGAPDVSFIKGSGKDVYAVAKESGGLVKAYIIDSGLHVATFGMPGYERPDQVFRYLGRNKQGEWISFGSGISVFDQLSSLPKQVFGRTALKDVAIESDRYLLIAAFDGLKRFDKDSKKYIDTLYSGRLTCVGKLDGRIYAGTINGLLSDGGKEVFHKILETDPALNTRITKLYADSNHTLWVATNRGELLALRHDTVIAKLNYASGLQCNKISAICVSPQYVVVGTDKGLYVLANKPPYPIIRHMNDAMGLRSNVINCLDIAGDLIWIGTTAGIQYCSTENLFRHFTDPRLVINSIVNDRTLIPLSEATMRLSGKSLRIDFDVIDHAGGQAPLLQYRLNDDDTWITLENSELYFPELPPGNSRIHIRAESPNWETKLEQQLDFYSPYPFYLRWWFILLCLLLVAAITIITVRRFIRSVRRKDEEKAAFQRRLLQLEQMALQGQMNPHFIFNCIAAIKQFYSSGDTQRANIFVDQFAGLIRQTFEMGTQIVVSLDRELHYLKQYLSIEQTRFSNSFDFTIETDTSLPHSAVYIPVMLLQPLAENAVRHGIRHLSDRRGNIAISVRQEKDRVTIVVADNGVGRAQSKAFRLSFPGMEQITSTTVNNKRLALLNELFHHQIFYNTEDIMDNNGHVAGTRITISYPLSIHEIYPK